MMKLHPNVLLISCIFLLSACQDETIKQPPENEQQIEQEMMPVEKIKEDALFSWEVQDGERTAELYLLADGDSTDKGDEQVNDNLAFYLVEGTNSVLQAHLAVSLEAAGINLDKSPFQVNTFGDKTMISRIASEGEENGTLTMWGYTDGGMKQVSFDDKNQIPITGNQVKFVKDHYLQTYIYYDGNVENKGIGWYYTTWRWDAAAHKFTTFDTTQYIQDDAYGWESGEFNTKLWHEHEADYIAFPHITLKNDFTELVKKGMLLDNSIQLGKSIDSVLREFPDYLYNDYYEGGPYYSYPDVSYFYDEVTHEITFLTLNGDLLTNDLASIISILGEPVESGYDEIEMSYYTLFHIGENRLKVDSDESGQISGFWLSKK